MRRKIAEYAATHTVGRAGGEGEWQRCESKVGRLCGVETGGGEEDRVAWEEEVKRSD